MINGKSHSDMEQEISAFIRERFDVPADDKYFNLDVNLWEEGYVDSLGVVEVIAHLEKTYALKIPEMMLFSPDFTSIAGMSRVLKSL
jgi:acyl carrier protein